MTNAIGCREKELFQFYQEHFHQLNNLKSIVHLSRSYLNQKHNNLEAALDVLQLWCNCILNLVNASKPYSPSSSSSSSLSSLSDDAHNRNVSFESTVCNHVALLLNDSDTSLSNALYIVIEGYLVAGCICYVSIVNFYPAKTGPGARP
ncbi:hypothetical protein TRICI_001730 [Trichomonascus ciferrii]|uniref:Uncharacterized protein n=1 Tax=Trichomonascus ciferrii TaxID=44093 RepID=A0A642V8P6_9ASCO|nr:hypothetical protein TRICI_001730 [Trichomonascus ciferrii]